VLARGTSGFLRRRSGQPASTRRPSTPRATTRRSWPWRTSSFAKDKVLMGSERRSMIISDQEKKVTAIHEAGTPCSRSCCPNADPIHKVTIIPRGMALGITQQAAARRQAQLLARVPLRSDWRSCSAGGIAGGDHQRSVDDGARQRHRAGHRDGASNGVRVGDERRHGAAHLRQERRADASSAVRSRSTRTTARKRPQRIDDEVRRIVTDNYARARRGSSRSPGDAGDDRRRAARARGARWRSGESVGPGVAVDERRPAPRCQWRRRHPPTRPAGGPRRPAIVPPLKDPLPQQH